MNNNSFAKEKIKNLLFTVSPIVLWLISARPAWLLLIHHKSISATEALPIAEDRELWKRLKSWE